MNPCVSRIEIRGYPPGLVLLQQAHSTTSHPVTAAASKGALRAPRGKAAISEMRGAAVAAAMLSSSAASPAVSVRINPGDPVWWQSSQCRLMLSTWKARCVSRADH